MVRLLKHFILKFILGPLESRGLVFSMPIKCVPPDVASHIQRCRSKSFCPWLHFAAAWRALEYCNRNWIEGDVVLCGVAHGGLAKFLLSYLSDRHIWLYDTFDGGTLPGEKDGDFERENGAAIKRKMQIPIGLKQLEKHECNVAFETVRDYVEDHSGHIHWIVGDVMTTLPDQAPEKIALLYLDTDWYESTAHELRCLESRVTKGGVIIQDDMGLCVGARKAVEEYYGQNRPFIMPMDEGGSMWVKTI